MEETRPLPGGAGWLRAQPMTRADSPGHLIRAWRASLLQMCAFLPGQASRGQDHREGPEQEQRQVWGPRCLPPSLPQWGKFQTAYKAVPSPVRECGGSPVRTGEARGGCAWARTSKASWLGRGRAVLKQPRVRGGGREPSREAGPLRGSSSEAGAADLSPVGVGWASLWPWRLQPQRFPSWLSPWPASKGPTSEPQFAICDMTACVLGSAECP